MQTLKKLPRLTRLEAAPGRYVWLLLRCGDYSEGMPILAGPPHAEQFLHERVIPPHEALGDAFPTSAIPLVGSYSDLFAASPMWTRAKVRGVREYDARWWDYPKLVNATWTEFFDHVERDLGPAAKPTARGVRTVRGDTGSCWEAWMLRIQQEHARFRKAQRDVVSLRTLCAMLGRRDARTLRLLEDATLELVNLGDHAWNGSSPDSKVLNLAIRRGRLERIEAAVAELRGRLARGKRTGGREHAQLGAARLISATAERAARPTPPMPMRPALLVDGKEVEGEGRLGRCRQGRLAGRPFRRHRCAGCLGRRDGARGGRQGPAAGRQLRAALDLRPAVEAVRVAGGERGRVRHAGRGLAARALRLERRRRRRAERRLAGRARLRGLRLRRIRHLRPRRPDHRAGGPATRTGAWRTPTDPTAACGAAPQQACWTGIC